MPPEGWAGKGPPASLSEPQSIFLLIRLGPLASHSGLFRAIARVLKCITRSKGGTPNCATTSEVSHLQKSQPSEGMRVMEARDM